MEAELTALAASGATALVGLMVSDVWALARERVGELFARCHEPEADPVDLDHARRALLAASRTGDDGAQEQVAAVLQEDVRRILHTDPGVVDELHRLLEEAGGPRNGPPGVHNVISGGTQHGPVIQSGSITGATLPFGADGSRRNGITTE